ncbi:MAG: phosphopantetheine-binding protein, partial [Mycetocola sp.]
LDSFGVVQLVTSIEDRFDITVDDDEFGAEIFETVGTLTEFVDAKLAAA